jgi:hypothetical protein
MFKTNRDSQHTKGGSFRYAQTKQRRSAWLSCRFRMKEDRVGGTRITEGNELFVKRYAHTHSDRAIYTRTDGPIWFTEGLRARVVMGAYTREQIAPNY